jgi:penicillin amidase
MTFNLGCRRPLAALVIGTVGFVSSAPAKKPAAQSIQHGTITIKRDTWDTPLIYANTVHGPFYGYGYAVAQDRLFQLEMARRTFTGRVAEMLGENSSLSRYHHHL